MRCLVERDAGYAYLPSGIQAGGNRNQGPFLAGSDRFAVTRIHLDLNNVGWWVPPSKLNEDRVSGNMLRLNNEGCQHDSLNYQSAKDRIRSSTELGSLGLGVGVDRSARNFPFKTKRETDAL